MQSSPLAKLLTYGYLAEQTPLSPELQQTSELLGQSRDPFFSICVPQYNRTSFLIEACRILTQQTCGDFELCVCDDCSSDGRAEELEDFLKDSGLRFVYRRNDRNLRYDRNLRSSISLARGRYCLLMGNDDCFAEAGFLERMRQTLLQNPNVGVAITNYIEYCGGPTYRRARRTGVVGAGPKIAASRFRNFSFVSGVILRTDRAQAHWTSEWDGSEMYQMYLACRILAEGYELLEAGEIAIRKGITLPGEAVDSYFSKPKIERCPVIECPIPLSQMGRLVYDAVRPYAGDQRVALAIRIFLQILLFTYPFWIVEYRRVQSWRFALGICLGMRPQNLFRQVQLPVPGALLLRVVYFLVSCTGLLTPISLFDACQPRFYGLAKSLFQRT